MPVRATKRGAARTPLGGDFDVVICGASFAGLAVARELRGTDARVLVLDRYEIGERQTSACAAPTEWLRNLGLEPSIRQTFGTLLVHTPQATARWPLGWTFSTFDYRQLCDLLWAQRGGGTEFETAKVDGKTVSPSTAPTADAAGAAIGSSPLASGAVPGDVTVVHTDRGDVSAPLIVDALGWKRNLGAQLVQPPDAPLSRGLEVHPSGAGDELEIWIDRRVIRAGYGWSFPAHDELRVGVGSFDPRDHVKHPTVALAGELGLPPQGYQGNWIPHRIRPAVEDGIFFAGDSAGHCLPVTAEGIRTAFYFGIACGRELRAVVEGRRMPSEALARYGAFSAGHRWKYECMFRVQQLVPELRPRLLTGVTKAFERAVVSHWSFRHYLSIAPPSFALPAPPAAARSAASAVAA
jgi:flavin-dependent dehydrogenase